MIRPGHRIFPLFLALALPGAAIASPRSGDAPRASGLGDPTVPPPPPGDGSGGDPQGGSEMRKSLALFFVHRARVEIGLADDQVLKLLPLVEKVEESRRASVERRSEFAQQLRRLADNPAAREDEVMPLIRLIDKEEERARLEQDRIREEMLALFTPQQRAKFVLFAHRFRGTLEQKLRDFHRGERGSGPGGFPGERGRWRGERGAPRPDEVPAPNREE